MEIQRRTKAAVLAFALAVAQGLAAPAAGEVIEPRMRHLRSGVGREWEEFPERPDGMELVLRFRADPASRHYTLRLRQRDVKQPWRVRVNGTIVGSLVQDENDMVVCWEVPAGCVRGGENELRVTCEAAASAASDDVSVGEVELVPRRRETVLSEASVAVEVVDADTGGPLPCRITVVDRNGALVTTGTPSGGPLAVRAGVVYARDGRAAVRLPAGRFTVYASRGFEHSLASAAVELKVGDSLARRLALRRVVPTEGLIACDTHVHTLTHSRHGDATAEERMITLPGEGVELAVATEHNLPVDYAAVAEATATRRFFTTVVGNEVTTPALGHFNVFPVPTVGKLIDWRPRDWPALARSIEQVAPASVVILNHARDVHGGFRPFDPSRHISVAGEPIDNVFPPANAMEVINSGATRADPLELLRDWFGLLNRGRRLTPVGASDSHDVSRYIVGQGRTYVAHPGSDIDTGAIDVAGAVRAIREGRVCVSYGLLTRLSVNDRFVPGDLATPAAEEKEIQVDVRVLGPEWTTVSRVALYVNGLEMRSVDIEDGAGASGGVKWQARFTLPRPGHDVHLVAIATGPGVTGAWWPCAKPYQPTGPRFTPYVLGATAPVYVDADGSGRFESAYDYARRLVEEAAGDTAALRAALAGYDEAVAVQVASVMRARHPDRFEDACRSLVAAAPPQVARGIEAYLREWRLAQRR